MIIKNEEVLQVLENKSHSLVHLYGEADAGRTLTVFSIAKDSLAHDLLPVYMLPNKAELRYKDCPELCPVIVAPTASGLIKSVQTIIEAADIVFIDNFLRYILHRPKKEIIYILRTLRMEAWVQQHTVVLVNDLRYWEAKGGYHPAYREYFRRYCGAHINVKKDSDLNIHYDFVSKKELY